MRGLCREDKWEVGKWVEQWGTAVIERQDPGSGDVMVKTGEEGEQGRSGWQVGGLILCSNQALVRLDNPGTNLTASAPNGHFDHSEPP